MPNLLPTKLQTNEPEKIGYPRILTPTDENDSTLLVNLV